MLSAQMTPGSELAVWHVGGPHHSTTALILALLGPSGSPYLENTARAMRRFPVVPWMPYEVQHRTLPHVRPT